MYYEYREPASKIPSHRMLAIRRGENENVLYFQIELDPARPISYLKSQVLKQPGDWTPHLELAIEDCYKRLLSLSIQSDIRLELKKRAEAEAIKVFRENLENLLLAPPAGPLGVLAIDPGIRTGCKIAVVDDTGKFLEHTVIYPHEPKNDVDGFEAHAEGTDREAQRSRHRDRQRHRVARDRLRSCASSSKRRTWTRSSA